MILIGFAGHWWFQNTQELPIVNSDAGSVAPGESIAIELPLVDGCGLEPWELYRKRFGRWQRTHLRDAPTGLLESSWVRVDRPILSWPKSEEYFYPGYCHIGPRATRSRITIPEDITWSPVAVCDDAGVRSAACLG